MQCDSARRRRLRTAAIRRRLLGLPPRPENRLGRTRATPRHSTSWDLQISRRRAAGPISPRHRCWMVSRQHILPGGSFGATVRPANRHRQVAQAGWPAPIRSISVRSARSRRSSASAGMQTRRRRLRDPNLLRFLLWRYRARTVVPSGRRTDTTKFRPMRLRRFDWSTRTATFQASIRRTFHECRELAGFWQCQG